MSKTTWTKLDDGFWMHPKVLMAGNEATGVFARLLSYCGAYLTDGVVPSRVVTTIAAGDEEMVDHLARCGLVVLLDSGAVEIPDFLEHNRSKAQVLADKEQRREAGLASGRSRRNGTSS